MNVVDVTLASVCQGDAALVPLFESLPIGLT
jgi:hypothetical protein